jgi:hypothetical protein
MGCECSIYRDENSYDICAVSSRRGYNLKCLFVNIEGNIKNCQQQRGMI